MQLNGLLLIDKPQGLTSHDVVAQVRRALGQKSVGHTGTLDPIATGLLVMVLGEATKLSDYLIATEKFYRMSVKLGVTTDTLDRTGKVETETPCDIAPDKIRSEALALQGEFNWQVPLYSAAKVEGKKLYEHGREGTPVVQPQKIMSFWNAEILSVGSSDLEIELSCSKGSFMRSWAHELGQRLTVGAMMSELRRTRVGGWRVEDALPLEGLSLATLGPAFVPMNQALPGLKSVVANPKEMRLMANGQIPRDLISRLIPEQKSAIALGVPVFVKVLTSAGELLAILGAEPGQGLKIRRVFRSFP